MTDPSIEIQAIAPFAGAAQGRNQGFRDPNDRAAAAKSGVKTRQDHADAPTQEMTASASTTHQLDVTI